MEIIATTYKCTSIYRICFRKFIWNAYSSLGYQFYCDVLPVFTSQDSFMKADYLIVSKRIGTASTISGRDNSFNNAEIDDISSQKFIKK